MTQAAHEFRVSVGHLAAFVHRGGDLGPRATPSVAAIEGLRRQQRHQQAESDTSYRTEVRLTGEWSDGGVRLRLGGRADGVLETADRILIEEIKTYRGDLAQLRAREGAAHDAQLKLYGALWLASAEDPPAELALELVYLDADTDASQRLAVAAEAAALAGFLEATCAAYANWLSRELERLARRDALLAQLPFPAGEFRPGQRQLARAVWHCLTRGTTLLAQAPTGIGKTLGVLYAALRRLPGAGVERLLYLTPRGSARGLALAAVRQMDPAGSSLRVVELIARERICPVPGTPCRADACSRASGHYDRRRAALAELLSHASDAAASGLITHQRVAAVATVHSVCPAALQRDAARFADLVVGDYNYGFDPFARQQALLDPDDGGAALLIDEAHNLPVRARAMFSTALDAESLSRAAAQARSLGAGFAGALAGLAGAAVDLRTREDLEQLLPVIERMLPQLGNWLAVAMPGPPLTEFERLRAEVSRFLEIGRLATGRHGDAFLLCRDDDDRAGPRNGSGVFSIRCLDVAPVLADLQEALGGLVLFSATLAPVALRRTELGVADDAIELVLPNPFPPERRLLMAVGDVDLRARQRAASLPVLVETIAAVVSARRGNYLVFVPSFAFLDQVADAVAAVLPEAQIQRQRPGMDEAERTAYVDAFRSPARARTLIGFAVSGGLFAEGVDLPGTALIGVVVAGLPLPAPDLVQRALADYHGAAGEDLAFRGPAITRVLQAAGRLVRDANDAGVVCIVDARLRTHGFARLLPTDFVPVPVAARQAGAAARSFWAQLDAGTPERY